MTTLIDSSVLLDLLVDDPHFGGLSETAIRNARTNGRIVVCEAVIAEIRPALSSDKELHDFCEDIGLEYEPCDYIAAVRAGYIYSLYLANKGSAKRVLPDFLIAAQAVSEGYDLLARDRGYYREYFQDLALIDPSSASES